MKPDTFIKLLAPAARISASQTGVLASITLAQAALESGWGQSALARIGNNLFGIKADSLWRGQTLTLNTREFIRGQWLVVPALWRMYPNWQASVEDHAAFLSGNPRYRNCLVCSTAQTFAVSLAQAGYATDPDYPAKLMRLIEAHRLEAFDREAS